MSAPAPVGEHTPLSPRPVQPETWSRGRVLQAVIRAHDISEQVPGDLQSPEQEREGSRDAPPGCMCLCQPRFSARPREGHTAAPGQQPALPPSFLFTSPPKLSSGSRRPVRAGGGQRPQRPEGLCPRCRGASGLCWGAHGPSPAPGHAPISGGDASDTCSGEPGKFKRPEKMPLGRVDFFFSPYVYFSPLFVLDAALIIADPTPRFSATGTQPRGGGEGDTEPRLASPEEAIAAVCRRGPAASRAGCRVRLRVRPGWDRELPCAAPPRRRQVALWSQGRRRRQTGCAPRGRSAGSGHVPARPLPTAARPSAAGATGPGSRGGVMTGSGAYSSLWGKKTLKKSAKYTSRSGSQVDN